MRIIGRKNEVNRKTVKFDSENNMKGIISERKDEVKDLGGNHDIIKIELLSKEPLDVTAS